jgi:hypothetical protein
MALLIGDFSLGTYIGSPATPLTFWGVLGQPSMTSYYHLNGIYGPVDHLLVILNARTIALQSTAHSSLGLNPSANTSSNSNILTNGDTYLSNNGNAYPAIDADACLLNTDDGLYVPSRY